MHRQQVVELLLTQPCPPDHAADPLRDLHPELVGDHCREDQRLHVMVAVLAVERLVQVERLLPPGTGSPRPNELGRRPQGAHACLVFAELVNMMCQQSRKNRSSHGDRSR
jgi:hypothetical protein